MSKISKKRKKKKMSKKQKDYSKLIEDTGSLSNYCETQGVCMYCNSSNCIDKIIYISPEGAPQKVLASSYCEDCGGRDSKMFTVDESKNRKISINATIKHKNDLMRFISITSETKIKFKFSEVWHEYTSMNDITGTIEGLLHQIVEDVSNIYGYKGYTTNTGNDRFKVEKTGPQKLFEMDSKLFLSNISVEMKDQDTVEKVLSQVRRNAVEPDFEIEIFDETGQTRIAPRNKFMREVEYENLDEFNDEFVVHKHF